MSVARGPCRVGRQVVHGEYFQVQRQSRRGLHTLEVCSDPPITPSWTIESEPGDYNVSPGKLASELKVQAMDSRW